MLSPGDIVTLTAAVRDLHAAHPGSFLTDVRTPCPAIWENNPHITPIDENEGQLVEMHYPLIGQCNQRPFHFINAYRMYLEDMLNLRIEQGDFKGDIHLSEAERSWLSQVEELRGSATRFWIIVAGGKRDFTAKWWEHARWQAVVDHFRDKILFVQVGEAGHHHPALRNVLDLRGKTDLRQLIRLVYHADGVLCPVTSLMHLAAAVPTKRGGLRPCVVVAGGREPVHWEAYPGHKFLHTIGSLPCCLSGGCWKSRVVPLGDGDDKDRSACERPVASNGTFIPQCLSLITPGHVIAAIEGYPGMGNDMPYVRPAIPAPERRVSTRHVVRWRQNVQRAGGRPGTELKNLLGKIGILPTEKCNCNKHAALMDKHGADWCEKNIEQIIAWIADEARGRNLPFARIVVKTLIQLAIRRSRRATVSAAQAEAP